MNLIEHLDVCLGEYKALNEENKDFVLILERLATLEAIDPPYQYSVKTLSGGYANDIWRLSFENATRAKFVIRIFRGAVGSFVNRELEIAIQWASAKQKQIAPEILFRFTNGVCYRYLDGEPISPEWLIDSFDNSLLMAEKVAKLHEVDTEILNSLPSFSANEAFIWNYIDTLLQFINEKLPNTFKIQKVEQLYGSMENIRCFVAEIRDNFEKYKLHPACSLSLCHNDLYCTNVIFNQATCDLKIIDFEYGNNNYCAFDIGDFFNSYSGVEPIESIDYTKCLDRDHQIDWIKHYLKHRSSAVILERLESGELDKLASEFYVVSQKMSLLSHVFWAIFVLIQSQLLEGATFDYIKYGGRRLEEYHLKKAEILSLDF